ncbi:hypothetical protein [Bacillus canaveralius]|uniref:hypothetical protein n=1 Tax=Bacillus canaveralius TaxID=1403243 RepID=UPI000F798283|nr:hypothetical protein [Bacillus canaveralius]RSK53986.1 hypothetical protein EJA13_07130 [Bacillus canaveralius]
MNILLFAADRWLCFLHKAKSALTPYAISLGGFFSQNAIRCNIASIISQGVSPTEMYLLKTSLDIF